MSKTKKKKSLKNTKVNYVEKITLNCKKASKNIKFNHLPNESIHDCINRYVDKLLESVVYDLEEHALNIQNKEFEIASEILFEQYERELNILEEFKKAIDGDSTFDNCKSILLKDIDKKLRAIEFLSKKTYNFKPKHFICKVEKAIFDSDEITDSIIKNVARNVPKAYFEAIFTTFFKRFQEYHTEIIQKSLSISSIKFSIEVESLNRIVEETEQLYEILKSKEYEKSTIKEKIEANIEKIKINNNKKLRGSYKTLHKFAINLGFEPVRQNGTSHLIFKKNEITVPIPNKKGDIKPGLLSSIIKQLGSSREEFLRFV